MAKLVITIDINKTDWDEKDPENFLHFAEFDSSVLNIEIGIAPENQELADRGAYQVFALATEYFKAEVELDALELGAAVRRRLSTPSPDNVDGPTMVEYKMPIRKAKGDV